MNQVQHFQGGFLDFVLSEVVGQVERAEESKVGVLAAAEEELTLRNPHICFSAYA